MDDLFSEFESFLIQTGRKRSTAKTYCKTLRLLLKEAPNLSEKKIKKFLTNLEKSGRTTKYLNNLIDTLRVFNHFRPGVYIPPYYKEGVFIKATLNDEEIEAFLSLPCPTCRWNRYGKEQLRPTDPKGWKMYTMFWKICAYSGMRMGEVAHLTVDRVDFGRSVFVLDDTKTNTPRFVPIAPNLNADLLAYMQELTGPLLFPSKNNGGDGCMDETDWGYNFKKRIKRLGIKRRNLTPYSLRHSMITRLLEEDVAFPKIMKIVGHKDPRTTLQYEHLTTKDINRAITKHPLIRRATDPTHIITAMTEAIKGFALEHDQRFSYVLEETGEALRFEVKIKR